MSNQFFSGRIPQKLFQRAEEYAQQNDKTKTEVLIEALSQYLDFPLKTDIPEPEVILDMLNELKGRLEKLESIVINNENNIDNSKEEIELVGDNKNNNIINNNNKNNVLTDNNNDKKSNNSIGEVQLASDNIINNKCNNSNRDGTSTDNNSDKEVDNKDVILISHAELCKTAGITAGDRNNLKNRAYKYAREKGYEIAAGVMFKPEIEVSLKKGIKVEGEQHLLFCTGINDENKPEWKLERIDNNSY